MEKPTPKWLDKLYESSIEYIVNYRKHVKEYALAILIVLLIRSTVGVVYQIPTGSMIPTFKVGDTLLANRFYYGLKIPFTDEKLGLRLPAIKPLEVGDIAIFRGPKEEVFYSFSLTYTSQYRELINVLNRASEFKGIIDHQTYDILNTDNNYIITEAYQNKLEIRLHQQVFNEYRQRLNPIDITHLNKETLITSYRVRKPLSFFRQVINTPLAGISMIATVLLRTPYLYLHKLVLGILFPSWQNDQGEIVFYPNRGIDTTKEYVKRVIAKAGDKVAIRNKMVYVNDQKLEWNTDFRTDPDNTLFFLTQEFLPHSPYSGEKVFTHALRFSRSLLTPTEPFDAENWPYDVETRYASQFRDNFGPIVVPPGHYFMMGDNRDESLDSRYIGTIPEEMISGTPMLIFFPWHRKGWVK